MLGPSRVLRARAVRRAALVVALAAGGIHAVLAQYAVPADEAAAVLFEEGLAAFEDADYRRALDYFERVYERRPVHTRTTAALVMAGKALYRSGEYARCLDLLRDFERQYPASRYGSEAGRLRVYAEVQLEHAEARRAAVKLGVALPMNPEDRAVTQAMFNGIRLAVRERNGAGDDLVRLVFHDTEHSVQGARRAVSALADQGVDAIIGPLYSEEAVGAAAEAERNSVVMVAPLATEAEITAGRRYVFQANPTIARRGAYLARWAVEERGLAKVGIVADRNDELSSEMAEGFYRESVRIGADVVYYARVYSPPDWSRLTALVGPEVLGAADAVFLAVHADRDREARRLAAEAVRQLATLEQPPHLLGSEAFGGISLENALRNVEITYVDTYDATDTGMDLRRFERRFREISRGDEPGRVALVGYDVAGFLLNLLLDDSIPSLIRRLEQAGPYQGLGTRMDFTGGQRNEAMFLYHVSVEGTRRAR